MPVAVIIKRRRTQGAAHSLTYLTGKVIPSAAEFVAQLTEGRKVMSRTPIEKIVERVIDRAKNGHEPQPVLGGNTARTGFGRMARDYRDIDDEKSASYNGWGKYWHQRCGESNCCNQKCQRRSRRLGGHPRRDRVEMLGLISA